MSAKFYFMLLIPILVACLNKNQDRIGQEDLNERMAVSQEEGLNFERNRSSQSQYTKLLVGLDSVLFGGNISAVKKEKMDFFVSYPHMPFSKYFENTEATCMARHTSINLTRRPVKIVPPFILEFSISDTPPDEELFLEKVRRDFYYSKTHLNGLEMDILKIGFFSFFYDKRFVFVVTNDCENRAQGNKVEAYLREQNMVLNEDYLRVGCGGNPKIN